MHLNAIWTTVLLTAGDGQNIKCSRVKCESIDKHVVFASLFHAKFPPVVAVRSLLPRSRPKYIMQAVVVLYTQGGGGKGKEEMATPNGNSWIRACASLRFTFLPRVAVYIAVVTQQRRRF